ncbi:hypothetical protein BJX66DRAFT_345540 [Aspergillus keveii]|uniref:Uncharacterized protein n=1 Tax=Aspergillus keveii TaxID=714993 RepID=A0ABR4FHQ0_9EURO
MASLSATSLWDSPGTAVWLQEPPKKSADDGMYQPPLHQYLTSFRESHCGKPGSLCSITNDRDDGNAAALPVGPVNGALEPQRFDALGRPLQMRPSVPPATTISIATSAVTSTVTWSTFSSLTTKPLSSDTAPASTSLHHATTPLTIRPPPISTAVTPLSSSSTEPWSKNLIAVAEAGIVLSVISMVLILLGLMIFWCVERKRKALQLYNVVGNDENTCNDDSILPEKTATKSVDSPPRVCTLGREAA